MKKIAFTLAEVTLIFCILSIITYMFFRIVRPQKNIYNHLYYSAYTQLSAAYDEAMRGDVYTDGAFDVKKFTHVFDGLVNLIGPRPANLEDAKISSSDAAFSDNHYPVAAVANLFDDTSKYYVLANGMFIRFDSITGTFDIIATVDVNGSERPNAYNQDIIQFKITGDGVLPVGLLETETGDNSMLRFDVVTNYDDNNNMVEERILARNLSFAQASCRAQDSRYAAVCDAADKLGACQDNKCFVEAVKP